MNSRYQIHAARPRPADNPIKVILAAIVPLVICAAPAWCQQWSPPPRVQVVDVTPKPGTFTEPSIAVNPRNPGQVVAAYQDNVHIAYTGDAGKHWETPSGVAPPNFRVSGDVSVAYDKLGHAILCYMAFDNLGTRNYWAHGATRSGLFVRRSTDGGKDWEVHDITIIKHPTEPNIPFEDKPYIVADDTYGPFAGNLYVGWTRWTLADSQILLSRSTDDGKSWSAPIEIDKVRGLPRDDNGAVEGFSGAVGADSTLYVVWGDGNHLVFTASRDGGKTFDTPRNIIDTAPIMFTVEDVDRSNGFPVLAIDPRSDKLYVAWSDYRNGGVDVFCSTSVDRGRSWTAPVRVNSDPLHNGADHFFQWLAVDPSTGAANLVFYDRRSDPDNIRTRVTLARSTDGGKSFANYAWTENAFDPGNIFMGDYTGIAALDGRVYGVWTEKPASTKEPGDTIIRVGIADFQSQR